MRENDLPGCIAATITADNQNRMLRTMSAGPEPTPTFNDILHESTPDIQALAWKARDLILDAAPHSIEAIIVKDRVAAYGVGQMSMKEQFVYIALPQKWVRIGFYYGSDIPDPEGLLEGEGKRFRHVKIQSEDDLQHPALRELIRLAMERQ
jgi:hypothetical protein